MAEKAQTFSILDPRGATSGLLDKVQLTIIQSRYILSADLPEGRGKNFETPAFGLFITYELEDGTTTDEFLIGGNATDFEPTDDGLELRNKTGKGGLWKDSDIIQYMEKLVAAGFPETKLTNSADCIEGVSAFYERFELRSRKKNAKGFMPQILAPSRDLTLPGGKKGKKAAAATATATSKPAASKQADDDADDAPDAATATIGYVKAALKAAEHGKMTLKELGDEVFTAATADKLDRATKNQVTELVDDAAWLDKQGEKHGWVVNEKRGTIAAE